MKLLLVSDKKSVIWESNGFLITDILSLNLILSKSQARDKKSVTKGLFVPDN